MTSTVATIHGEGLAPSADRQQDCQLLVIEGVDMGRAARILPDRPIVAGTEAGCDLVLGDDRVSGRHLSVRIDPAGFVVHDLDSRNGTLYAGSAVGEVTVSAGATFKVGQSYLRIQPRPEPLEVDPSQSRRFGDLVAESLAMRELFAVLELAAASADVTVLLQGETGTGKELAARALHETSERRRGPFVAVDCGALPESLLESELFGHLRGAFTGATADRKGAFARANGGTILLDELDSIPLAVQARLLRAVEERAVRPVGSDREQAFDARIVGASRADLAARVAEGTFRPDLFYRLSVLRVIIPPLRQRREDIPLIVGELLVRRGFDSSGEVAGAGLDRLIAHDWPGNVRELRNVIDRAITLAPSATQFSELRPTVRAENDVGDDPLAIRADLPFSEAKQLVLQAFEARYLRDLLGRCEQNISRASREGGIDRKHLKTLLRRHGLL